MKIEFSQLPEGQEVVFSARENPQELDLEVNGIRVLEPIEVRAEVFKIQDTLSLNISLKARARMQCSRCLSDAAFTIAKGFSLSSQADKSAASLDITEDIRQEIMLEYPLKPLCRTDCKGLCVTCGKSLNDGPCNCASENK